MNISKRDRRVLIIGALVVACILLALFVAMPLADYLKSMEADKQERETQLLRMIETIQQKEYFQQALNQMKNNEDDIKSVLLEGDDPNVVSSELHRIVTNLADQQGISVTRVDASMKPERFDKETIKKDPLKAGFLKIKVRASIKCTPDKLAQFLSTIEGHPKFLLVDRLEIRAWNVRPDKEISPDIVVMTYMYLPETPEEIKKRTAKT